MDPSSRYETSKLVFRIERKKLPIGSHIVYTWVSDSMTFSLTDDLSLVGTQGDMLETEYLNIAQLIRCYKNNQTVLLDFDFYASCTERASHDTKVNFHVSTDKSWVKIYNNSFSTCTIMKDIDVLKILSDIVTV